MVNAILNGCNGAMGRVITDIVSKDDGIRILAGVDVNPLKLADYEVYETLDQCPAADGFGYFGFFADRGDEGVGGERAYDAGCPDDGDAANDAQLRVECPGGEFFSAGNGDRDCQSGTRRQVFSCRVVLTERL